MSENGPMPSLRSRLFMRAAYCLYINICIGSFCYFGTISVRRHPDRISCAMSSRALITKKKEVLKTVRRCGGALKMLRVAARRR